MRKKSEEAEAGAEFKGKNKKNREAAGIIEKGREEAGATEEGQEISSNPTCMSRKILAPHLHDRWLLWIGGLCRIS